MDARSEKKSKVDPVKRKASEGPSPPKPPESKRSELEHSILDPVSELTSALNQWSPQGRDPNISDRDPTPEPEAAHFSDPEDIEVDVSEDEEDPTELHHTVSGWLEGPNHPNMPGEVPIPQAEMGLREEIVGVVEEAHLLFTREDPPPNYIKARKYLETVQLKLLEIQKVAITRIGKATTQDARTLQRKEWSTWKMEVEDQLDTEFAALMLVDNRPGPEQEAATVEINVQKEKISQLKKQIDDAVQQLENDIKARTEDGNPLSKTMLSLFQQRITELKKLVKPELTDSYNRLMELDPANRNHHGVEQSRDIAAKDKLINDLFMDLVTKPVNEASFGASALHSTPLNQSMVDGNVVTTASRGSGRSGYDYRKQDAPVFDGSFITYPAWREEMMNDVCVGKGDAAYVRLLQDHCPIKNLCELFPDPNKAWEHLNDTYCNPDAVSGEITTAFLTMKKLKGNNDQQRLINLFETVTKLHNSLVLVQELHQLRDIPNMHLHIIKLTPINYRMDLTRKLDELKEAHPNQKLTPSETYSAISKWLEKTKKHIIVHCRDALAEQAPKLPAGGGLPPGGGRHGGGRGGARQAGVYAHEAIKKKGSSRYGDPSDDVPPDQLDAIKLAWDNLGKCIKCGADGHMYEGGKDGGKWEASDSLADCPQFYDMDVDARAAFVLHRKACCKCLSTKHDTASCTKKKERWYCRVKKSNGEMCKSAHHNFLHGCRQTLQCAVVTRSVPSSVTSPVTSPVTFDMSSWTGISPKDPEIREMMNRDVMLPVVTVRMSATIMANFLLDGGSQSSFITHKKAEEMNLEADYAVYEVRVVGHEPEIKQLRYYCAVIKDNRGKDRKLVLLGLDQISELPGNFSVKPAYSVFPHAPPGSLDKAAGQIDVLIGNDNVDLLPGGGLGEDMVGQLRMFAINFGPGRVLTGSHPQIRFNNPQITPEARGLYHAQFLRTDLCAGLKTKNLSFSNEAEMTGHNLPPQCKNCITCTSCSVQDPERTVKAQMELSKMRKKMTDPDPEPEKDGENIMFTRLQIITKCSVAAAVDKDTFEDIQPHAQAHHDALASIKVTENEEKTVVDLLQDTPVVEIATKSPIRERVDWLELKSCKMWQDGHPHPKLERDQKSTNRVFITSSVLILVWLLAAVAWLSTLSGLTPACHAGDWLAQPGHGGVSTPQPWFGDPRQVQEEDTVWSYSVRRLSSSTVKLRLSGAELSPPPVYSGSKLEEQLVAVQRLTLLLAMKDQHTPEPADPDLHMCEDEQRFPSLIPDSSQSAPIGPTVPETPISPGPTVETEVPLNPHQARLRMFAVWFTFHLGAQKCEVRSWQCIARQQIDQCENNQ